MATIPKLSMEVVKMVHSQEPIALTFPEAAGQSFLVGEMVFLSGGKVTVCVADPAIIFGLALDDASGTEDTLIRVVPITASTVLVANYAGTDVTAQADIGQRYGLTVASNKWHVDKGDTTNTRVLVIGLDTRDAVGDIAGRVHAVVLQGNRQIDTTS